MNQRRLRFDRLKLNERGPGNGEQKGELESHRKRKREREKERETETETKTETETEKKREKPRKKMSDIGYRRAIVHLSDRPGHVEKRGPRDIIS